MASLRSLLLLTLSAAFILCPSSEAYVYPPLVRGLSWNFYQKSCPKAESIIRSYLRRALKRDIGLAAGLVRIHFHDCFVQGCEGSVLLTGQDSEQQAPPNLSLRQSGFRAINEIRALLEKECGRVVSCSDIATIAARDSVFLSGGPDYQVPTGRRDGVTFANRSTTLQFLPPPFANTSVLIRALQSLTLDVNDLVALSGAHTIGISHCTSFTSRLYPTQDPTMNQWLANNLKLTCPRADTDNTTVMDIRTPNVFDNKYYVGLMNKQGLFTSDQDLHTDRRTKDIVVSFAVDQNLFFEKFVFSMVKMSMLSVLTGRQGEIRADCSVRNPRLSTLVDGEGEAVAF